MMRFPDTVVSFCLYHLSANAFKNLRKKGLLEVYTGIAEAKALLRCLPALAFLPSDEVHQGFADIARALVVDENSPIPAGAMDATKGCKILNGSISCIILDVKF